MTHDSLEPIVQQVLTTIQQSQFGHKTIVLAYSGGVDSQVLLHALATLKRRQVVNDPIKVIHVNHGLSTNADTWQKFTSQQANKYGFDYQCIQVNLRNTGKQGIEAAAREARYNAIYNNSPNNSVVVTAHHQDDQLETMLLALKRGAGVQGLAAMQQQRQLFVDKILLRPLLAISRTDIESYAHANELPWVEDESNDDQRFDRNFLRQSIIPLLQKRWPHINQTVSRSAKHCQQAQQLLDELAENDFEHVKIDHKILSVPDLMALSEPRLKNVMRYFIHRNQKLVPSVGQLEQIIHNVLTAKSDKSPYIQLSNYSLRRYKQQLHLCEKYNDVTGWVKQIDCSNLYNSLSLELPDNLGTLELQVIATDKGSDLEFEQTLNVEQTLFVLSMPENTQSVTISFNHDNPKCLPNYRQQRRSLKKILQELNIPVWQRQRLPFVIFGKDFAAALPLFVCKEYVASHSGNCLKIIWTKP